MLPVNCPHQKSGMSQMYICGSHCVFASQNEKVNNLLTQEQCFIPFCRDGYQKECFSSFDISIINFIIYLPLVINDIWIALP